MRPMLALLALLALAVPAAQAGEDPKFPADGAPEVTTASGLKYSVLKAGGTGKTPIDGDPVTAATGLVERARDLLATRKD